MAVLRDCFGTVTVQGKVYILFLVLVCTGAFSCALADTEVHREHTLKAAFVYNFMKFVQWPDRDEGSKERKDEGEITVGFVSSLELDAAFGKLDGRRIGDRIVRVKLIAGPSKFKNEAEGEKEWVEEYKSRYEQELRDCDVLFVCSSEEACVGQILKMVKQSQTLTIGESDGFAESGGVIGLLIEKGKLRFEVNSAAADMEGIKISSKLLRLAKRVIKQKQKHSDEEEATKGSTN